MMRGGGARNKRAGGSPKKRNCKKGGGEQGEMQLFTCVRSFGVKLRVYGQQLPQKAVGGCEVCS